MQWFRMYSEFATDPKVQMLDESDQRRYVMLLCIRCGNVAETFHDEEVAFQLRISNEEWSKTKQVLVEKNLIDEGNIPKGWDKRQYRSDSSTERVKAYRDRKKKEVKQERNVTVTPPEADTDTEEDTDKNTPLIKTNNIKTPPKPPSSQNGVGVFKIMNFMEEGDLDKARGNAPGWDVYELAKIYDENIANGREIPKHPAKAFPAWCGKYTKGNRP